jgi:predicted AlkP superfamily phosphohydrolase/phosphomutase
MKVSLRSSIFNFKHGAFLVGMLCAVASAIAEEPASRANKKLYWLIPDGMRADPEVFDIFKWANEGKLPNIKRMMDQGTYGYSIPVYPSHTPVNFATLLTGSYPAVHGVTDGPMHTEGSPLEIPSISGFSSTAKKVPPIWKTLEENGKVVALLSIPGSTPPELDRGYTFRGRWGGWGADFHSINCQAEEDLSQKKAQAKAARLFTFGPALTEYVPVKDGLGTCPVWGTDVKLEISLNGKSPARIAFSIEGRKNLATLAQGEWSDWFPADLKWNGISVSSHLRFKVIKLGPNGFFRVRILCDGLNSSITKPSYAAKEVVDAAGPMVDFVDNYPAQLVYYPEDKATFIEESDQSFEWHRQATRFILDHYSPDVFIHDIYSPNQMLTSRWWMGYVDPKSARYNDIGSKERKPLWSEVLAMYRHIDDLLGEMLKKADQNTIIALSSDHGALALDRVVRLNNLFAREGLLSFKINDLTGEPEIDWARTKAIFLSMQNIYLSPRGLAGPWKRASGPEYEALRQRVKDLIMSLHDKDGKSPVNHVLRWEEAQFLEMPADRSGDLILSSNAGYGWVEDLTRDRETFATPLISGYKQTPIAETTPGLWTPFIVMGPGVRKGFRLEKPIHHVDQYPTLMTLLGVKIPSFVQGKVIQNALLQTR